MHNKEKLTYLIRTWIKQKLNFYPLVNIYHCSPHKAGSQWIRAILKDPLIRSKTGLGSYLYENELPGGFDNRNIDKKVFNKPMREYHVCGPLYLSYEGYKSIPKPKKYKAFYIKRDPRDLLISHYFSFKESHRAMGDVIPIRIALNYLSFDDGLKFLIDFYEMKGINNALSSWVGVTDPHCMIIKYEDLIGVESNNYFKALFNHLEIDLSEEEFENIVNKYSFKSLAGRDQGEEDKESHYRKGVSGDWKNYFNSDTQDYFNKVTNNLSKRLGYE